MIDIKKKPSKTYIEIYHYKTNKKIVTLLYSKEALHQAKHIHKYFRHHYKITITTITIPEDWFWGFKI